MKDLKDFILEAMEGRYSPKRYKASDIDLEKYRETAEKIGADKDSIGSAVAELKSHMVNFILGKMLGVRPISVDLQAVKYEKEVPIYDDKIEEILFDNFIFVKSKEGNVYLAPKVRSKASVKRWLGDDFYGTVDNPMYD